MVRTARKVWLLVPLLALVFAFACAPAAFASDVTLQGGVQAQENKYDGNGIGKDILDAQIVWLKGSDYAYTGSEITPPFKVMLNNQELKGSTDFSDKLADYYYFFMNNTELSEGVTDPDMKPQVIVATFSDNEPYVCICNHNQYFNIVQGDIANAVVTATNEVYTGKPVETETLVTFNGLTLTRGTDYTVSYKNNKKVGTATAIITGIGHYKGQNTVKFKITKASIKNAKFTNVKDKMYTGKKITPKVTVKFAGKKLKKGRDYTIKYSKNKNVGTAKIKIKGKKNLKGTQVLTFGITPCPLSSSKVSASVNDQYWTGGNVCPTPTLKYKGMTLKSGRDFTVRYSNNARVSASTGKYATATVHGKGNYSGVRSISFSILKRPIDTAYIDLTPTKSEPTPEPRLYYNGQRLNLGYDFNYDPVILSNGNVQYTIYGLGEHFTGTWQRTYKLS